LRRNQLYFPDGLDSDYPARATSSLVVTHHPFLWRTSGCCVWCLLSSHVNSTYCHPRRNYRCLSAGKFWVRIYVLNVKTCLSYSNERITVGYHRLFSHRSFNTSVGVRVIIALMGASATQGSIKVKHTYPDFVFEKRDQSSSQWWYVNALKKSEELDKYRPLMFLL
jgi:hypothetical protein